MNKKEDIEDSKKKKVDIKNQDDIARFF